MGLGSLPSSNLVPRPLNLNPKTQNPQSPNPKNHSNTSLIPTLTSTNPNPKEKGAAMQGSVPKAEGEGGELEEKTSSSSSTAIAPTTTSVVESPSKPNGTRMAAWKRPTDVISDANTHTKHTNVADSFGPVMGGAVVWPSLGDACAAKSPDTKGGPSPSSCPSSSSASASLDEHSNYQVLFISINVSYLLVLLHLIFCFRIRRFLVFLSRQCLHERSIEIILIIFKFHKLHYPFYGLF